MAFTASVATKAGLGLGALGAGATTVYFGGDYVNNFLSKYERALIGFLEGEADRDIVFEVKKDGKTDLATSDMTFTTGTTKVSVSVKVEVSSGSSDSLKKSGTKATEGLDEIKSLNNGTWTWECEFKFKKTGDTNDIKDDFKHRIFQSENKGLFGILKKDLSSYTITAKEEGKWTKSELKQVKIDFISRCGYERGVSENRKINGEKSSTPSKIEVEEFNFVKETGSENKLIPEDVERFNYWFEKRYGTNEYKTN